MKSNLTRTLILAATVFALLTACSSKEEKAAKAAEAELKQARQDAEKAFTESNYPPPQEIKSGDLRSGEPERDVYDMTTGRIVAASPKDEGLQVLNLGAMPAPEVSEVSEGSDAAPVDEPPSPAPEAVASAPEQVPHSYEKICTDYLRTSQRLFDARCAGRMVGGVGRVQYSYPLAGTRIVVGNTTYQVNLKSATAVRLYYNDIVALRGVVGSKTRYGSYAEIDDAIVETMAPKGTPAQLLAMKTLQMGEICLDLKKETSPERVASALSDPSFIKKGALHPTLPHSGSVEIQNRLSSDFERCLIENNKIKVAQIGRMTYIDGKEVLVWEDRAASQAKINAYLAKAGAAREAEEKGEVEEYNKLPADKKLARLSVALEASAEAIAEAIPKDISAQGSLELCNVAMESGLRSYKEIGSVRALEEATISCSRSASTICNPDRRTSGCRAFHDTARPVVRVVMDAR
ncbi:MAG: hypothetical protein V4857_26710 [Pseudomonadota bacterium]